MKQVFTCTIFLTTIIHCCAQISEGYTDNLSYRYTSAGTNVIFYTNHVSATSGLTDFELKDLAGNPLSPQEIISGFNRIVQNTPPSNAYMAGYGYQSTKTWTVPDLTNLPSGYYLLDNNDPNHPNNKIPIIIKGDNTTADIVIVIPTNTTNAYTTSDGNHGGHSLYPPGFNTTVSFHRPQNHPHHLYFAGFTDWVRTWAAAQNPPLKLNFISDTDLGDPVNDNGWNEIKDAKLLIIPGHSEYWTRQARLNFDKFVNGDVQNNIPAKNAIIMSGNTMWAQVRLQNDPNNSANPQMVCYRGANWCSGSNFNGPGCYIIDPTAATNPLQGTYAWMSTDLKYSVLGSIGCDWLRGGQVETFPNPYGNRILIPGSPLLNWQGGPSLLFHDIIPIPSSSNVEYDGTLVESDADGNAILDGNGDPVLDIAALGFYHAEMVGYNQLDPNVQFNNPNQNNQNHRYCPFLVFKKTCTSGTIINISSTNWCYNTNSDWTINQTTALRPLITANIIKLMINDIINNEQGTNLFYNTLPNSITLKPAYTSVSYSACSSGSVNFTPCGVYLEQAYKVV